MRFEQLAVVNSAHGNQQDAIDKEFATSTSFLYGLLCDRASDV